MIQQSKGLRKLFALFFCKLLHEHVELALDLVSSFSFTNDTEDTSRRTRHDRLDLHVGLRCVCPHTDTVFLRFARPPRSTRPPAEPVVYRPEIGVPDSIVNPANMKKSRRMFPASLAEYPTKVRFAPLSVAMNWERCG